MKRQKIKINNKTIKKFKRLLKELGIYKAWLESRLFYIVTVNEIALFSVIEYAELSNIINYSFTWSDTGNPNLWEAIFYSSASKYEINYILNHEEVLSELKEDINTALT